MVAQFKGNEGLWVTTDGGTSWRPAGLRGPIRTTLFGTVVPVFAPSDATVVYGYVQVTGGPLATSRDGGATWTAVPSSNPGGLTIGAFAIDPKVPTTLYAAMSPCTTGFCVSVDGGATWSAKTAVAVPAGTNPRVLQLAFSPADPTRLYAYAESDSAASLAVSEDGGGSWKTVYTSPQSLGFFAPSPSDPAVLYLAIEESVCRSADAGATWTCHAAPPIVNPRQLVLFDGPLFVDEHDSSTLYLVREDGPSEVDFGHGYKSTDGGATWSPEIAPWFGLAGGRLYANTSAGFSFSADGGGTWQAAYAGSDRANVPWTGVAPSNEAVLYANALTDVTSGLTRSADHGRTWSAPALMPEEPVFDPMDDRTIVGVDETVTFGPTGATVTGAGAAGLPTYTSPQGTYSEPLSGLSIAPDDPTTHYACAGSGLYVSHDRSASWSDSPLGAGCASTAVDPLAPSDLYALDVAGALMKSSDRAATWTQAAVGLPSGMTVTKLTFDPTDPATVFAAATDAAGTSSYFVSHGRAATFSPTNWSIDATLALVPDPHRAGVMYAYSVDEGVLKTKDGGATWAPIQRGIEGLPACGLAISPTNGDVLYLGTCEGGLYMSATGGE